MTQFWKSYNIGDFVLLAGGRGTRLWPLSKVAYKGLIEFTRVSLLAQNISRAALFGAERVIILTDHPDSLLSSLTDASSGDGLQVVVRHCPGTTMLDKVRYAMATADMPLCVGYGDTYASVDFGALFESHRRCNHHATLTVARYRLPYGVVAIGEGDRATDFEEKPWTDYHINIGYYVLDRCTQDALLNANTFPSFLSGLAGERRLGVFVHPGQFESFGELNDLARAANGHELG